MIAWHKAITLVVTLHLCGCRNESASITAHGKIYLEVTNSLAIPNHFVAIDISGNLLTVSRQNQNEESHRATKELTADDIKKLWVSVDAVDWRSVKKDDVLGLDGTNYSIRFGGREFEVWTPEYNTDERDLTDLVKLKTLLWQLADITQ